MISLKACLTFSAVLFGVGLFGALTRRHAVIVLISIEVMLNAANLNFIAFWRFNPHPEAMAGPLFVIFNIAIAAAEAAVGLALVIAVYRSLRSVNLEKVDSLKG